MHSTTHHPPHIYLDDTWYMITSSVYGGRHWLQPESHKALVRDQLRALVVEFRLTLAAWVILDNHNHILVKSHTGPELNHFVGRWHGRTSFDLNRLDSARGRQVWHSFWDTCICTDADFWTRFNYIHFNPIKHWYVSRLENWPWSSYHYYLEHKGGAWLADVLEKHPVVDFTDPNDGLDKARETG